MNEKGFVRSFTTREIQIIQVSVFFLFLGRAWQGIFWDLPLREFFWDQYLLEGLVTTLTGGTWQDYVTHKTFNSDTMVNVIARIMGLFWLFCAVITVIIKKEWKWARLMYYLGSFFLFLIALLYFKEFFMALGQLFEYTVQITAPLFLVYMIWIGKNNLRFRWALRIAISITFFCHGLYAYGYYMVPNTWVEWTMRILWWVSDTEAVLFLKIMGILDFVAAIFLLLPIKATLQPVIIYCIVWGFLTALARIVANFYIDTPFLSLHTFAYETSMRLVHGALPLLLWYSLKKEEKIAKTKE